MRCSLPVFRFTYSFATARLTGNKKGEPCACHLLDNAVGDIPVHYRSKQKECLLNGKSAAEKKQLKRRIEEIKTGKPKRSRKTTVAAKSSSGQPPIRLPIPSPSPEPEVPEDIEQKDEHDEEPVDDEERQSEGKSKFAVKMGFSKIVKLNAMGEYIVDAVMRYDPLVFSSN
jgi:hypothetical protein